MLPMDHTAKDMMVSIILGAAQSLVQLSNLKIIHRDIKPENFLLVNQTVKLGDFGLSEMGEKGFGTQGTP